MFSKTAMAIVIVILASIPAKGAAQLRYEALETPTGIRFIVVSGYFDAADDLEEFTRLVQEAPTEGVTFDSRGGNIGKAMELGRLIRRQGLSTIQPWIKDCLSACAWAFIGGAERLTSGGAIGVHQSSYVGESKIGVGEAVSDVQLLIADLMQYVVEMGVDLAMLQLALRYDTYQIRYITEQELEEFRLNLDHSKADIN